MISERDATTIVAISSNCDRPSLAHGEAALNLVQNQSRVRASISKPSSGKDLVDRISCGRRNYSREEAIGIICKWNQDWPFGQSWFHLQGNLGSLAKDEGCSPEFWPADDSKLQSWSRDGATSLTCLNLNILIYGCFWPTYSSWFGQLMSLFTTGPGRVIVNLKTPGIAAPVHCIVICCLL